MLTILWLAFIYSNSLKTGVESGEQSGRAFQFINSITDFLGFDKPISENFIRKAAHFIEFAVLSALICVDAWAFGFVSFKKKLSTSVISLFLSVPISAVFASIDELLQNFSDGRAPSVVDILIDSSGALTACILCILLFCLLYHVKKSKREEKY